MHKNSPTDKIEKRLNEGFGRGSGKSYKPWISVQSISSIGRSHRIYMHTANRVCHLLSDLEASAFFMLDWNTNVTDLREQYPLDIQDTIKIAHEAGIKHPAMNGEIMQMTSDILVDYENPLGKQIAYQAKYTSDLYDQRTIEKLEIERRYWHSKNIEWKIITEREIPQVVLKNIKWITRGKEVGLDYNEQFRLRVINLINQFHGYDDGNLIELCKMVDKSYDQDAGESLKTLRNALGYRLVNFDITIPANQLMFSNLIVPSHLLQSGGLSIVAT